jgi:SAM-dependent methyltransferase
MSSNFLNVILLKYPHPFKAAVAISNDTDGLTWGAYEELHQFINSDEEGPMGTGLGLEVGNSFWIWSDKGEFSLHHAGPWDSSAPESPESHRIRDLVECGWLDTLHSFGDWRKGYYLDRSAIKRGFEILDKLPNIPEVFVNHGGGDLRTHNIGGPWPSYQAGDDPKSSQYILDQLLDRGIKFYWTDKLFENEKFGDDLTNFNSSFEKWETVNQISSYHKKIRNSCGVFKYFKNSIPISAKNVLSNKTFFPLIGRDGNAFYGFKRFRGKDGPHLGNLNEQLSRDNLNQLVSETGTVIIYQHLGVWRPQGSNKLDNSLIKNLQPSLTIEAVESFKLLAELQQSEQIFVTTVSRLLKYLQVRDYMKYNCTQKSNGDVSINIEYVDCPVVGRWIPTLKDICGISFQVPAVSSDPEIFLNGRSLKSYQRVVPSKNAGSEKLLNVYLPWKRLEWIKLEKKPKKPPPEPYYRGDSLLNEPQPPISLQLLIYNQIKYWLSLMNMKRNPTKNNEPQPPISHQLLIDNQIKYWLSLMNLKRNPTKNIEEIKEMKNDLIKTNKKWKTSGFPNTYGPAVNYAYQMHIHDFDKYLRRIKRLGYYGKLALDAGCGSGTWSFALANNFDQVIGIDKTRNRVDLANWLVDEFDNSRINISYGDVMDINYENNIFDFVFCNGVLITTAINIVTTLREFFRVLAPGGSAYICLNGIGWSKYLRDYRGAKNNSQKLIGYRGLYNTHVQTIYNDLNFKLSDIRVKLEKINDVDLVFTNDGLTLKVIKEYIALLMNSKPSKFIEVEGPWTDGKKMNERILSDLDFLGKKLLSIDLGLAKAKKYFIEECNSDFFDLFLNDVLKIFIGFAGEFSLKSAGFGYEPKQIEAIVNKIGFQDFRWGEEAELSNESGQPIKADALFGGKFNGELKVWEFTVTKPLS